MSFYGAVLMLSKEAFSLPLKNQMTSLAQILIIFSIRDIFQAIQYLLRKLKLRTYEQNVLQSLTYHLGTFDNFEEGNKIPLKQRIFSQPLNLPSG